MVAPELVLAIGIAAIALLAIGFRGRRIGSEPRCRRCGYDVTRSTTADGSDDCAVVAAGVCAECGADLSSPKAIRLGRRRRRPLMMVAGGFVGGIVLAHGLLQLVQANRADWLAERSPTWVLMIVEPLGGVTTRVELLSRIEDGTIAASSGSALVERLLTRRDAAMAGASQVAFDAPQRALLRRAYATGLMTEEQVARWVRRSLEMRPPKLARVRSEQAIPIMVHLDGSLLGSDDEVAMLLGSGFIRPVALPTVSLRLDHVTEPIEGRRIRLGGISRGVAAAEHGIGTLVPLDLPVGPHAIEVGVTVTISMPSDTVPLVTWTESMSVPVVVDPSEGPEVVPIVAAPGDDALRARIRASLRAILTPDPRITIDGSELRFVGRNGVVAVVDPAPHPISVDIVIVDDRGEHLVETLVVAKGRTGYRIVTATELDALVAESRRVDVVLRPNVERGRSHLGTSAIWGEEIVFEAVPLGNPVNAVPAPAATR